MLANDLRLHLVRFGNFGLVGFGHALRKCRKFVTTISQLQLQKRNIYADFGSRISFIREKRGISLHELSGGAAASTAKSWQEGKIPRQEKWPSIASRLGLSVSFVFLGQPKLQEDYDFIAKYADELTPRPKSDSAQDRELAHVVSRESGKLELVDLRWVPVVSWTHAGTATAYDQIPQHEQERVATSVRDPRSFAVIVEGESMLPDFKPGDRVILSPSHDPRNGRPVVAKLEDDGIVLRIYHRVNSRTIRLASLRPDIYPTVDYSASSLQWVWPVEELNRKV